MLKIILFLLALCCATGAQAQLKPGQAVAPFDTELLDGRSLRAEALKGKVVLVVFWATWCPPCQRELPELQRLYERYRSKGFEILALSIDADRFVVEEFWKDHEYAFPVAMKAPAHTAAFGPVRGTPTLYLLDRNGVLRLARVGPLGRDKLETALKPLL
jgi:thiol-disulfide isomerase/thioredoxin